MNPVHHDIGAEQEDRRLRPERQLRQRAVPVIIERDQPLAGGDAEEERGADHEEADAQIAGEQRNEKPIAKIGHQFPLAPPGAAGIASPDDRQKSKDGPERDRHRQHLHNGHADAVHDRKCFLEHDATLSITLRNTRPRVSNLAVKML